MLKASKGFFPDLLPLSLSAGCINYEHFDDQSFLAELSARPLMNSPKKAELLSSALSCCLGVSPSLSYQGQENKVGGPLGLQGLRPGFPLSFFQLGETPDRQHIHFITPPSRERNGFLKARFKQTNLFFVNSIKTATNDNPHLNRLENL